MRVSNPPSAGNAPYARTSMRQAATRVKFAIASIASKNRRSKVLVLALASTAPIFFLAVDIYGLFDI
jgi:hypothetical protein